MNLSFEVRKTVLTAKITGELDHHNAKNLREKIDLKLASGIYNLLIFDFTNLSFMDSSAIALILGRVKNMEVVSGYVKIRARDEKIIKILKMAGIQNFAEII